MRIHSSAFSLMITHMLFLSACGGGGVNGVGPGGPPPANGAHQWTWISGADADLPWDNSDPIYGNKGVSSSTNVPGGRNSAASWSDPNGNFWLFGGIGLDANIAEGYLNDLWEFTPNSNTWTWVSGSSTVGSTNCGGTWGCGQQGAYGVLGAPSISDAPGGRSNAVTWSDSGGNLWLFGGSGYDAVGAFGRLGDLWKFNVSTKQWTWVSGSDTFQGAQNAVYGTKGTPAHGNMPPGLESGSGWMDKAGNLWLFGGVEYYGICNNMWKFDPSTTEWTWVTGGGQTCSLPPSYGTIGLSSPNNDPGARAGSAAWTDRNGQLWLFGGDNWGTVFAGVINDLWVFSPVTEQWTWISGSNNPSAGTPGQYGTEGVPSVANMPGGRSGATAWSDTGGKLWLFGGTGFDSTSSSFGAVVLNDLWEFDPSTNLWTWTSGSNLGSQPGVYGTKGAPSSTNSPGGRYSSASWIDGSGNLWLFAGWGYDNDPAQAGPTILNDLWRYEP